MVYKKLSKNELIELYSKGFSMMEISKKIGCSHHKVAYWFTKYNIKRRTLSDAIYIKSNPGGDPFHIKEKLSNDDLLLKGYGLGIYWGEGNKVTPHAIRVANTDISMLKSFIRFLNIICGVKNNKITYSIVCFNDSVVGEVTDFWARELNIPVEKFGKIVQVPQQGKGNYKRKSKYGVCTVSVHNIKLKKWIMDQIQEFSNARVV